MGFDVFRRLGSVEPKRALGTSKSESSEAYAPAAPAGQAKPDDSSQNVQQIADNKTLLQNKASVSVVGVEGLFDIRAQAAR